MTSPARIPILLVLLFILLSAGTLGAQSLYWEDPLFLARDNALPTEVLMSVSETYVGIAEKITGKALPLSDNPKAEIVDVLGGEFGLID